MQLMYWNEILLLFSITPSQSDAFIKHWKELKISINAEIGVSVCVCVSWNGKYSWTTISTSSPLRNLCPCHYSFNSPSRLDDSELPSTKNCTKFCVVLHHYAEGSQPATVYHLGHFSNNWDVAISTTKRKHKRLFMNGCKYKGPSSTLIEFLN